MPLHVEVHEHGGRHLRQRRVCHRFQVTVAGPPDREDPDCRRALKVCCATPEACRALESVAHTASELEHVCAFARRRGARAVLTVVPRLAAPLTDRGARLPLGREVWADTHVILPADLATTPYTNLFTGHAVQPAAKGALLALEVGAVLGEFPVGLLEAAAPAAGAAGGGAR